MKPAVCRRIRYHTAAIVFRISDDAYCSNFNPDARGPLAEYNGGSRRLLEYSVKTFGVRHHFPDDYN